MSRTRNSERHTSVEDARLNILRHLEKHNITNYRNGLRPSTLGYVAFPDYNFRAPQGAAFAVGKILRNLQLDDLIGWFAPGNSGGWYLRPAGRNFLTVHHISKQQNSEIPAS
jgi:hypothetical protein